MPKSTISTISAPPPLPQFSQATVYNGIIFCSGALGIDPESKQMVHGTIKDRARRALLNLKAILEAGGSSLDSVLKVNIYLTDMTNFGLFNEAWDEIFTMKDKPVGSCFYVLLARVVYSCVFTGSYVRCRSSASLWHRCRSRVQRRRRSEWQAINTKKHRSMIQSR